MKFRWIILFVSLPILAAACAHSLTLNDLKGRGAFACKTVEKRSPAGEREQMASCEAGTPAPTDKPVPTTTPDDHNGPVAPLTAITDTAPLLTPGYARPDGTSIPALEPGNDVGAFRIICKPSHLNYDDAIVYTGVKGGSPHGHLNYGNTLTNAASTYSSLRTTGDSTCENKLARSAYWAPWLQSTAGQVILPDYIFNYYKRLPASDPRCLERAPKGCARFPAGLRAVAGYDLKRMGQRQTENVAAFNHRCITEGKPSIFRAMLSQAIADCGGEGQIITAIAFPDCWDGLHTDSTDHRSHLAFPHYDGTVAYPKCDVRHPYLIPQLTQQYVYTVKASDGVVAYSCDRMPNMHMTPGTCFHADVMEAWEPAIRDRFEDLCLNKRKSCVDGELGDGTMLKHLDRALLASPRLVEPPVK